MYEGMYGVVLESGCSKLHIKDWQISATPDRMGTIYRSLRERATKRFEVEWDVSFPETD